MNVLKPKGRGACVIKRATNVVVRHSDFLAGAEYRRSTNLKMFFSLHFVTFSLRLSSFKNAVLSLWFFLSVTGAYFGRRPTYLRYKRYFSSYSLQVCQTCSDLFNYCGDLYY